MYMKAGNKEIKLYDENDTTYFIDKTKPKSLKDLGFNLSGRNADKSSKHPFADKSF